MAEDSRGGRNRRRYFRRKSGDKSQASPPAPGQDRPAQSPPPQASDESAGLDRRARVGRRKRRGRNRRGGETRIDAVSTSVERDTDYQPPTSVYIYTHIVHPPASGAYEFRSEHFSKVGRTLDDYQIDIDSLFAPPDKEARQRLMEQVYADWDASDYDPPPAPEQPAAGLSDVTGADPGALADSLSHDPSGSVGSDAEAAASGEL